MAGSLPVCGEGLWSEGLSSDSAPRASCAQWYTFSGRMRGSSKRMTKEQRLAKRAIQARAARAALAKPMLARPLSLGGADLMSERVCNRFAQDEVAVVGNTVLRGGHELSDDESAVKTRSVRECHRVFLYDMLKECIDACRYQITTEIERTYGGCLQDERTQVLVMNFLEAVGLKWQLRGRQWDDTFTVLMLELFPRSVRVLDLQLAPARYVSQSQFVFELDAAWRAIRGVPQRNRAIRVDEATYGTMQCYTPIQSMSSRFGVMDSAPSSVFPNQFPPVVFVTQDSNAFPPIVARVDFNKRSVQRDVWDDV